MIRPRFRLAFALTGLVLAALGLSACRETISLPKGDVDYCTIVADAPVKDGNHIAAAAHYTCDGAGADSLTLTVKLERKNANGSWTTLVSHTFVAKGENTTRNRTQGTRTRKVTGACGNAEYRSSVHTVERSHGHKQSYDNNSVGVTKPCSAAF